MSKPSRPNFFQLLELDPNKPWSDSEFKQVLKKKQAEWTTKTKNPKHRTEYQGYLDMVKQITQIMGEPETRDKEQKEAIENIAKANQNLKQKFEEDFKLLTGKPYILEAEVQQLITQYTQVITESDIRNQLNNLSIEIKVKTNKSEDIKISATDKPKIIDIEKKLELLKQENLYTFLGLSRNTATDQLLKQASKKYEEISKTGQATAEASAIKDLSGHAKTFFENDEKRKIYDWSLSQQMFRSLEQNIETITRQEKKIHPNQFDQLLELAISRGVENEEAKNHIIKYAESKKIAVQMPTDEAIQKKISCPKCQKINQREQNSCSNCGTSLKIKCPSCGLVSTVEDRACSQCSFPIGNDLLVRDYLWESQNLFNQKNYEQATNTLILAKQAWSTISPSSSSLNDPLTQEIERLKSEVEQKRQELINCRKEINNAIDERYFYQAKKLVKQIEIEVKSIDLSSETRKIEAEIHKAETELIKARNLEKKGGDPVDLYQNILWICKDCQPAKDALAKTPPLAASQLFATPSNKIIHLSWQPSPSKKVTYTIVRQYNSPPISSNDGEQLATVSGTTYDDTKVEIGKPVFYAVYTNREGVLAEHSAKLNKPILLIGEVSNVIAQAMDKQVRLSWKSPDNVSKIYIYRSTQPFNNSNQGHKLEVINNSNLLDKNLENGKRYYYKIYTLFKNYDGQLVRSEGVIVNVIPEEPPKIIKDLEINVIKTKPICQLKLSWTSPSKGEGAVLQSDRFPNLNDIDLLPQGALREYGKLLQENKNYLRTTIEKKGIIYFTPVVLFQKTAYIGKTKEYVNVDDVSNLKCQKQNTQIQVRWDWPENCQQVIFSYSDRQFPSSYKDKNATHIRVTKAQYNLKGYYPLKSNSERDYFIVVHAVWNQNGQSFVASGLSESARGSISLLSNLTINYKISRKTKFFGLFKGKLLLTISPSRKGEIPELILVYKKGGKPMKKNDGDIALKIPSTIIHEDSTTLTYELEENNRCFGKLFLVNDNLYESQGGYCRINQPASDNMEMF